MKFTEGRLWRAIRVLVGLGALALFTSQLLRSCRDPVDPPPRIDVGPRYPAH